jgi:hypothetical protein
MPFLKCPDSERLFEFVTIPTEMSLSQRGLTKFHLFTCASCKIKKGNIENKWAAYFQPEPEVTSSLIKIYSRLQNDETLILRGWKLGEQQSRRQRGIVGSGWVFRGGVALGVASLAVVLVVSQIKVTERPRTSFISSPIPYAQIRVEDKNRIQVQYVRPELMGSMEFQTTDSPEPQPVSTGSFR